MVEAGDMWNEESELTEMGDQELLAVDAADEELQAAETPADGLGPNVSDGEESEESGESGESE
jgi:hypothetical protein